MAAVWPQIHLDLSLALPVLGVGAVAPLIEILALAPTSKLLYGSDVHVSCPPAAGRTRTA